MNSRILITGGSGLLALNWALATRDRYSVTLGLHNRDISFAGVQTRRLDLESVEHLVREFETVRPQIVIHTVGLTSIERCEADPELAQHVNVGLATNVAQACNKLGLPLVHISTDHLFAGTLPLADENCSVEPVNVYGRTKAEAERRVLAVHPTALIVRTNFYGWGTGYRHSFSDVVIETLRAGKEITLFQDVFYTPILAETAVQAIHDLIELRGSGIFHVVGDDRISKYVFGLNIAEEFDLDSRRIIPGFFANQAHLVQRPHDLSLSNQKARDFLGRRLGGVGEHINRLAQQERAGVTRELRKI